MTQPLMHQKHVRKDIGTTMNLLPKIPSKHKTTGFTLIEILIAMLILSVGLLGLAGFQATSARNNVGAYNRSQASQLAYDLADRMRANLVNARLGILSTYKTTSPSSATAVTGCKAISGSCTPAQMAQNDLFEWNRAVDAIFPGGSTKTITFAPQLPPLPTTITISILWDADLNGTDANDPASEMSFQIWPE